MATRADADREPAPGPVEDWVGLGQLIALATERISMPVEGIHRAITRRTVNLFTTKGSPIRALSQSTIGGVYTTVRSAGSLIGSAIGLGAQQASTRSTVRPVWATGRGRTTRALANGVWGDELNRRQSALAIEMQLVAGSGEPIPVEPAALGEAFPAARSRLVMLIHGWSETEQIWHKAPDHGDEASLIAALESEGRTVLLVRYNSGLHVPANGAALAELIAAIVNRWPTDVERVDLVGHSMGGLVARSAVLADQDGGHSWSQLVEHLVTLGTPHLGSPIEKTLALVSVALRVAPESRPIGDFLDLRSSGVKDLRFGTVTDAALLDVDAALYVNHGGQRPNQVKQHFAVGVVTRDPDHPLGKVFGDLVVRPQSGTGRGTRRRVAATNVRVFGGRRHPDLLHDPEVHAQVRTWLA